MLKVELVLDADDVWVPATTGSHLISKFNDNWIVATNDDGEEYPTLEQAVAACLGEE
ncbi:hypothetical protein [Acinetobacter sp. CFCC 10889]|uniref:hypothetical protein n=1 Tax=Acinetobacter sp. CFCC 10889 TaxID=1775557 RepID=UPI0013A6BB62|nr:hypothetical protein [Acinetobacter sp. CFCC 10889]